MEERLRRLIFFKPRLSEKINHLCAQGTEVIYDKEMKMSNFIQSQILCFSTENSLCYCVYDSTGLSIRQLKRKNLLYIRKKLL